ncbi:glycosyltransferase family 2 protein [candidate division KSB1 bacterium]|nr:glycosyltransferase family 2 protein [candidate division KSB1 bacterium]NIR72183.1 glycosyltransferase family 2 protein [candidate division KSB1 bacterium]NIS26648.1 glycosyltransferase family 2 protein [candidate division KSB1 bacterium]NIT73416.1 glycosyltransferase family 2 protein [candidate division KSB1 bacterium]NIU27264.1 glycosyltransferase family 2 protein [candidate division KSB1 bacterium]
MKLIIQIPCLNEEDTLPRTIRDLPRAIEGIDEIETLIIDDGSTDQTVEVARQLGVNHMIRHTNNKGLAEAFMTGIDACLKLNADIIVNTDGDNQYKGENVVNLIKPILEGKADMVVGDRQVNGIPHFSFFKKRLQTLGSWVVQHVSDTQIPDTTSGFRAFSREAALRMNVVSKFTYTLETIIQAGKNNIAITHVPVETNPKLRDSRLFDSIPRYLKRSIATIFRIYTMYEPLKTFSLIGAFVFSGGFLLSLRFLYFYFTGDGSGHIQSLILSAVLMLIGFQVGMIGLLADLIRGNRRLIEDTQYRVKKLEIGKLRSKRKSKDEFFEKAKN